MADPASPECPIGGNGPVSEKWPAQKHQRCIGPYGSPCLAFPCRWCAGGMALAWRSCAAGAEKACARGIPIRKSGRDAARMSRSGKGPRADLTKITQSADRSCLFWWMVENHDELKIRRRRAGSRTSWAALCAEVCRSVCLTDIRGRPASQRAARETWLRQGARSRCEKAVAAKPPPRVGAVYPSRIPKDWRPTVVPPMRRRRTGRRRGYRQPVAKPGVPARAPAVDPPLTEEEEARVEAALDQAREQFREKDWYLNPFPPQRGEQTDA